MIGMILSWFATLLGGILRAILPSILKQGRKPQDAAPVGFDKDLQDDMKKKMEDQLNG